MPPAWEYRPGPDVDWFSWPGLVDPAGNAYWIEWTASRASLRSVNRDGRPRFAVALALPESARYPAVLLAEGLVVVAWPAGAEARSYADGAPVWRTELTATTVARLLRDARVEGMQVQAPEPARAGDDLVFAVALLGGEDPEDLAARGTVAVALDLGSGRPRWATRIDPWWASATYAFGAVDGRTWFSVAQRVAAVAPGGGLRYQSSVRHGDGARAVGAGVVLGAHGEAISADSGAPAGGEGPALAPMISDGAVTALVEDPETHALSLARRALPGLEEAWRVTIELAPRPPLFLFWTLAGPILTAEGTVVLVTQPQEFRSPAPRAPVVRELGAQGEVLLEAPLAYASGLSPRAALRAGRLWLAGGDDLGTFVRAYDLPGRTPAEHGWIADEGGMERDRRAR